MSDLEFQSRTKLLFRIEEKLDECNKRHNLTAALIVCQSIFNVLFVLIALRC